MLVIIASAVIYTEIKDSITKSLSEWARLSWGTWELRLLVLVSLTLQFLLVKYGNRCHCTATGLIPPLVWSAYLLADWVATVTLSNLLHSVESFKPSTPLPPTNTLNVEIDTTNKLKNLRFSLRTFWAPFLLLHLGGPDTITAYSLEDNELWLRRLMGVGFQVALVIYMFFTYFSPPITVPGDPLPFVAIPVFIAGTIKCVDRSWSLWSASNKQWRSSLFSAPPKDKDHEKEKGTSSSTAGTSSTSADMEKENQEPSDKAYSEAKPLHDAYMLFHVLKFLYGGVNLNFNDYLSPYITTPGSTSMSFEGAFRMVQMEIGLLYDVLYTKTPIIQSIWGRILRIISFFCSISALVAFSVIIKRPPYAMLNRSDLDISITYLLLVGSVIVEIYWVFYHIFSSWTLLWLSRDKDNILFISFYNFISLLKSIPSRVGRDSNMFMAQHNIYRLSRQTATAKRFGYMKLFQLFHDKVGRYWFTTLEKVDDNLKESIFTYLNSQHIEYGFDGFSCETLKVILERRGYEPIRTHYSNDEESTWNTSKLEFDHSILLWHIATDMLYDVEKNERNEISQECKRSKLISDYMFYLLLELTTMMPHGISDLRIRDTCNEVVQVLERTEKKGMSFEKVSEAMFKASEEMFENGGTGDGNKSLLRDGINLAKRFLHLDPGREKIWDMTSELWIEMLTYAASHCEWKQHAKQLGRGVELLTHVSLLMAHLGFTPQIEFSDSSDLPPRLKHPVTAQNIQCYLLYYLH